MKGAGPLGARGTWPPCPEWENADLVGVLRKGFTLCICVCTLASAGSEGAAQPTASTRLDLPAPCWVLDCQYAAGPGGQHTANQVLQGALHPACLRDAKKGWGTA